MVEDLQYLYSIEFDEQFQYATIYWEEQVDSQEHRAIHEQLLEFVKKHKVKKLINVLHFAHTISLEDQQWLLMDFIPRIHEAGLRYSAVIIPQTLRARFMIDQIVERVDPHEIETRFFPSIYRAKQWLNSIEN